MNKAETQQVLDALKEYIAITSDPAGFEREMLSKEGRELDAFIARQELRVIAANDAAKAAIAILDAAISKATGETV